ncbi:response regulator transcription factor [Demequina zhanjiangensis]|uniref:Response regulator transcription factor n=1 Tax=Demequina zhanjiangensis TaxID=3051659 RepID=A0ABT8G195_9MICO|nr:response regulator transcription factor [Demequina sp. SYSU T00b26]MDN4472901.1 response regulator transcription factor [Demequina sp. SYSU T00b26]
MTIRVVLADDQALLRGTFTLLLNAVEDIEVVGEASDGEEAVAVVRSARPDVVVMDLRMPRKDGVAATEEIASDPDLAHTKVLVLTTFETEELVLAALRAGASGFLGKGVSPADLIEAIRTTADGERLLSPAATRALIERVVDDGPRRPRRDVSGLSELTERERELVALAAEGLSNEEIAARLVISPATVKTHINRAMMKLGARDRAQLVVFAYDAGLA